jgi:phage FluMu protein Com
VPIDVQCNSCGKRLRAPDNRAGKQVRCPQCKETFTIPAAQTSQPKGNPAGRAKAPTPTPQAPAPAAAPQAAASNVTWTVQLPDGEQYGPVSKTDLDEWLREGRLDSKCQVLREGWDQWKWADEVFPELTGAADDESEMTIDTSSNPLAAMGAVPSLTDGVAASAPAVDTGNPYAVTSSDGGHGVGATAEEVITPGIVRALSDTRPCVMFLSIVGFVMVTINLLATLGSMLLSLMGGAIGGIIVGFFTLALAGVGYYAFLLLLRYGIAIKTFKNRGTTTHDLQAALVAQAKFWKMYAVFLMLTLGYAVVFFAMIILFSAATFSAIPR